MPPGAGDGVGGRLGTGLVVFVGLLVYFLFARRRSHLAPGNEHLLHGITEQLPPDPLVHEGPSTGP